MTIPAYLILALIQVESGGNPSAVGDGGKAVGVLQIHQEVIDDVNRIAGASFTAKDRLNRDASIEIFRIYVNHYATEARLGRPVLVQDIARIWNGGPRGHKKLATVGYWVRVRLKLGYLYANAGLPVAPRAFDLFEPSSLPPIPDTRST